MTDGAAGERPEEGGSGLRRVLKGVAIGVAAAAVALLGARAVLRMRQPVDESLLERKRRELRELRRRIEVPACVCAHGSVLFADVLVDHRAS